MLKPGGLLVLVDPRQDHLFGRFAIEGVEERVFGLKEVRIYGLTRWRRLLEEAGFSASQIAAGPLWSPVAWGEVFIEATA